MGRPDMHLLRGDRVRVYGGWIQQELPREWVLSEGRICLRAMCERCCKVPARRSSPNTEALGKVGSEAISVLRSLHMR